MALIDLHQHSIHSFDGTGLPSQRLRGARDRGYRAVAITDHNSVESLNELADWVHLVPEVDAIPGVEFDAFHPEIGVCHYLGLGFDPEGVEIRLLCERYVVHTFQVVERLIEASRKLSPDFHRGDVMQTAVEGGYKRLVPYHVMMALYYKRISSESIYDVFQGVMPGLVKWWLPTFDEIRDAIHKDGGLLVLAHPGRYPRDCPINGMGLVGPPPGMPEDKAELLFKQGMDALETNQPSNMGKNDMYEAMAAKHHWPRSGGTDYHGWDIQEVQTLAAWFPDTPAEYLDELDNACRERHKHIMHRVTGSPI